MEYHDPFAPDWSTAPEWAKWHAVSSQGHGSWYDNMIRPFVVGNCFEPRRWNYGGTFSVVAQDWRNSLRHRPAAR